MLNVCIIQTRVLPLPNKTTNMETVINQLKEKIANETDASVRIGLRTALLLIYEEHAKQLTNEINNHIKQN